MKWRNATTELNQLMSDGITFAKTLRSSQSNDPEGEGNPYNGLNKGRLRPKGLSFLGFRYNYERVGI